VARSLKKWADSSALSVPAASQPIFMLLIVAPAAVVQLGSSKVFFSTRRSLYARATGERRHGAFARHHAVMPGLVPGTHVFDIQ
jgi:hypothetical protein